MSTFKAVFLDLDGTLLFGNPDIWTLYAQFAREIGLQVDEEGVRRAERFAHLYFSGFNYKNDYDRLGGGETWRRHYLQRSLHAMLDERVPLDTLGDAVRHLAARLAETPRQRGVPPDVRQTLDRLQSDGYLMALVTNRSDEEMADVYDPHNLHHYFAFTVTSSEGGAPKPFRAMFDLALQRAGCAPGEAVHVGDNPYADVAGAQGAGIFAVLYDPKGLFPEADCRVITAFPQLLDILRE